MKTEQGELATTGRLLYLLLGSLWLSHLKAESLNLLTLALYLLLFVAQLASQALLCRPGQKVTVYERKRRVKTDTSDINEKWFWAVILPEVCESFIELRKLLHGQFSLAVGFFQLLRLSLHLLTGLHDILAAKGECINIKILVGTSRQSHLNTSKDWIYLTF